MSLMDSLSRAMGESMVTKIKKPSADQIDRLKAQMDRTGTAPADRMKRLMDILTASKGRIPEDR